MDSKPVQIGARSGHPADAEVELPAAQLLAEVTPSPLGTEVRLPPRFAWAAVESLLTMFGAIGDVIEGAEAPAGAPVPLQADQWAIRILHSRVPLKLSMRHAFQQGGYTVYVFPKHTVILADSQARYVLRALETAKPKEVDAKGRPRPWVPVRPTVQVVGGRGENEDDAVVVETAEQIPATEPDEGTEAVGESPISDGEIRTAFAGLARSAGWATPPPFVLQRGIEDRHGFVTGLVHYTREFQVLRVRLKTCPNSDWAEILATAAHELAHPLSRTMVHGEGFKRTLVDLASRHWGEAWFVEARARVKEAYAVVDRWVTSGIRAALREGEPPAARVADDGQLARILSRIRKLNDLGRDQCGLPEGIAATAAANDLVTLYGLEDYRVSIDAGAGDQMVDRWIQLEDEMVWRRSLASAIARYFGVFSLSLRNLRLMHLFGSYADLVTVEYLYSISAARIVRECEAHLGRWRQARGTLRAGEVVRERVSFCDSAVAGFSAKLDELARGTYGSETMPTEARTELARQFAETEHARRGESWSSGRRRTYRDNAAGRAVGRSLEITRGLSATGEAQRRLSGG